MADTRLIDENLIGIENYRRDQYRWLSLRCCDFFTGTGIKSYNEVITNVNPNITFNLYMAFRRSIAFTFKKLKLDGIGNGNTGCNIDSLILSKNKKSVLFRIWFTKASCIKTSGMNLIQKLCDITNCRMPDQDVISKNLGCWNISFLLVHLKEFALQLSRNSLPINARLAARYRTDPDITIDEGCRLCRKNSANGPIPRETFAHFFYDCTITNTLINGFRTRFFSNWTDDQFKNAVFIGTDRDGNYCLLIRVITILLLNEIWKARNRIKYLPSAATIADNIRYGLESMMSCNKKFQKQIFNSDLLICRTWWPAGQDRRG
jgi:hypothetical protein